MTSLASVERYLALLPGGIDAYPECIHKGEPLALWLQQSPTEGLAERLPAQVAALLVKGDNMPVWVPEVHAAAIFLAIREAHFADDAAFLAHARECNRAVLATPGNRILFWVASPRAILRGGPIRWGALHRGSSIEVRTRGDGAADVTVTFPAHLFPEIVLRGNGTGFAVAIENAGGQEVALDLRVLEPTRAVFTARWR